MGGSSAAANPPGTGGRPDRSRGDIRNTNGPPRETHGRTAGKLDGGLYIVATPIGNAADVSLRALDVLKAVDVIACEDTRVTSKLLAIHGISTALLSYHDHNADRVRPRLIERLKHGESVALASDAGTPLISDPGYKLVRAAVGESIAVTAVPGPSAVLTALVLSGLPTDRFLFAGFLPPGGSARRKALAELAQVDATLVVMESAKRLASALRDMAAVLGDRPAAVAREMTKMFEEVRRDTLSVLARHYQEAGAPKGEVTIVIGPPGERAPMSADDLDRRIAEALATHSVRDAAEIVAGACGVPRRQVYARALALKGGAGKR
ncbi:MAG: 16S rRNA (cytidine(1402)-2'-O)-methyltransferase [Rhodospirillales bacterium]|nr:16S rRNA (cytidine(1402)-2'-O)-methyltransferase [Rhodospirillales bacterium]